MRTGFVLLLCLLGLAPLAGYAQVITRLTPTSPDFEDDFSAAVAVTYADDGTWALIGAPGDNDATGDAGSVFAYHRSDGGAWELQAQLFAPHEPPIFQGGFGNAVALEGRWAVVGETGIAAPGQAYVLRREGEGIESEWVVEAVLAPDSLAHPDHVFGVDVALDTSAEAEAEGGFVAVVGAVPRELLDPVPGAAHVFRRVGEGKWVEEAVLRANQGGIVDGFGRAVAASAGRVAVGAYYEGQDLGENNGGAVYIYRNNGNWTQEIRLEPSEPSGFGAAVGIDGEWLVVGNPGEGCPDPSDNFCGAVYYYRSTDQGWLPRGRYQPSDIAAFALLGNRLALALPYALVAAPRWNTEGPDDAGAVYLYRLDGDAWRFERLLRAPDPGRLEQFGRTVALSATTALVGTLESLGAAYAFDLLAFLPNEPAGPQSAGLVASVFPNPTVGPATLRFQLSEPGEVHVEVFDALGRVVWRRAVRLGAGTHAVQPEVGGTGLYLVRLRTSTGETATAKLLRLGR